MIVADTLANNAAAWFLTVMLAFLVFAIVAVAHEKVHGWLARRGGGGGAFPKGWAREAQGYRETKKMERHMGHRHGL